MPPPRRIARALPLVACLVLGCGGAQKKSEIRFVAEDTFLVDPAHIRESQTPRWHLPLQEVHLAVRTAAALENNCPLEQTEVLINLKNTERPRIAVRVCGVERVYQELEGVGYIDVSRAVIGAAPPVAPIGAAQPSPSPDALPPDGSVPVEPPSQPTPPTNPEPAEPRP